MEKELLTIPQIPAFPAYCKGSVNLCTGAQFHELMQPRAWGGTNLIYWQKVNM